MAIPKEPRQLMINLMYLVLTALLALNVSAEVMNAFFSLDKGMKDSGLIVDRSNEAVMSSIDKQADAYKSDANEKWRQNAKKAKAISEGFISYIEGIRKDLWEKAGGDNPKVPGQPKDIRNKDLTTKMFINDGLGQEIQNKLEQTRQELLALADGDKEVEGSLPLKIEEIPAGVKAKNWPEFKFKQMPVAAVFPILGKIQSDAKNSYSSVLNFCAKKVGGEDIKFDKFTPAVSAEKSYVIQGEKYAADVFLSAYSTKSDNVSISVNGSAIPMKEGIARYETTTSGLGERTYRVSINVKNPLTGAVENFSKEFKYEVGQRSVAVSLDKMNVFYIGVDNPISVSAAGVSSNDVKVSATGVTVNPQGGGKFVVRATTPGEAVLTVAAPGVTQRFTYRVKRIPDPTPLLGAKHKSKAMANGEFKAQGGIAAVLEAFDFDAKCDIAGFEVTYLPKRQDPITKQNSGARWNGDVQDWINKAKPGDAYFFDDIKCKCPGDAAARNLGGLAFKIR
ncbi:MAG TPA: gliding motility protein GldM [Saprospiraceae bacterium]|nr:gliding motility protein GldM [Saprospiraceae bacterium]